MYKNYEYVKIHYFQTFMTPSLPLDIRSLWFNFTEAKDSIESR